MFLRKQGYSVTNFAKKTKVSSYKCWRRKNKMITFASSSYLTVVFYVEFRDEIQRKTPPSVKFKTILTNSRCKLFLGLELRGVYMITARLSFRGEMKSCTVFT